MRRRTASLIVVGLACLVSGCGQAVPESSSGKSVASPSSPPAPDREPASAESADAHSVDSFADAAVRTEEAPSSDGSSAKSSPAGDRRRTPEEPPLRRQTRPAGQLTAGSIDDVERSDEFCQFLDRTLGARMFAANVQDARPCVMFQVKTDGGRPVGGAELTMQVDGRQDTLHLTTGSDGRAMLTGADVNVQDRHAEVVVRLPDGSSPLRRDLVLADPVCEIVVQDFQSERPQQLDLALVLDTTGSMGDELEYLKTELDDIVARLRETFPNVDQHFALIVYRDQGDQYVSRRFDFTGSLDELRRDLAQQRAAGGGDGPEAVHVALQQAATLDWRPGNVARVAFLVGDAPPHDADMLAAFEATSGLRARGVRLYPVASSGADLKAEFLMRSAAFLTMGQYLFLTDHSGIGNPHAAPHTSQYLVEHLNRLMVRMITSELCGRRLIPDEVLAIERGDMVVPYGVEPVPFREQQQGQGRRPSPNAASLSLPDGAGIWVALGVTLLGVFAYDSIRSREGAS